MNFARNPVRSGCGNFRLIFVIIVHCVSFVMKQFVKIIIVFFFDTLFIFRDDSCSSPMKDEFT